MLANPVDILKEYQRWTAPNMRTRFIDFEKDEFKVWWDACIAYRERNPVASDFVLFSLLQAGRSIEASALKWSAIDLDKEVAYYGKTKNKLDYGLPLSSTALEVLQRCDANRVNEYVFGYEASETGHIPKDSCYHYEQIAKLGAKYVSSHDLRRTWASAARHLDIEERTISYCLKHTIHDVNERYFMKNQGKLRKAFQDVDNFFVDRPTKLTPAVNTSSG